MIIVNVADMVVVGKEEYDGNEHITTQDDAVNAMMNLEIESKELVKGFGKTLLRLFQQLNIQNAMIAAEG